MTKPKDPCYFIFDPEGGEFHEFNSMAALQKYLETFIKNGGNIESDDVVIISGRLMKSKVSVVLN